MKEKEGSYKTTDYFLNIEKEKEHITNKNKKLKQKLVNDKEKLKEFNTLALSANSERDKLIHQIDNQNKKIYNIKNQISVYSSLGFKTTSKSILKKIIVDNKYQLAFYLALGDE